MRKSILILGHNDATQFIDIYNQYTRLYDKEKYDVTVAFLTGAPNEETRKRVIAENILFLDIPKKQIRHLKINAIRKLLALTKEKNFETVVCHRYKASYIMMAVNHFHHIPNVICVMHELKTMKAFGRQILVRLLADKKTIFAGVSNAVRDDLRKSLSFRPTERVVTLYNCLDVELTEPFLLDCKVAREKLNLPTDAFVFGSIGRLVANKDQASLIHAFSLLKPYYPNSKLIILGDGGLEQQLRKQIQIANLTKDVILTGFIPNAFQYMQAFDCFVLPSIQEAFGRVLIEAMIARLPIIASAVNGIPEVVGDAGLLIQPNEPLGLSQSMKSIIQMTPQQRQAMGNIAYQHVIDHYSIPSFQKQYAQLPYDQHPAEASCK